MPVVTGVFPKHVGEGSSDLRVVLHEVPIDIAGAEESAQLDDRLRERGFADCAGGLRVVCHRKAARGDDMAKVFHALVEEKTLLKFKLNAGFADEGEHLIDLFEVLLLRARKDHDIFDVDEACLPTCAR